MQTRISDGLVSMAVVFLRHRSQRRKAARPRLVQQRNVDLLNHDEESMLAKLRSDGQAEEEIRTRNSIVFLGGETSLNTTSEYSSRMSALLSSWYGLESSLSPQ
jgi:hypothetical protein